MRVPGDLKWIDDFVATIRPYIYVRESDNVLIRMPNEAFKLNETGARLLAYLVRGGKLKEVFAVRGDDPELAAQVRYFFTDLSMILNSGFCDSYRSPALETVQFTLGYITLPVLSEVALTKRCNIKCSFCYASCYYAEAGSDPTPQSELTTSEVKQVLTIIKQQAQVPSVSFTGGEPSLRTDLEELVRFASRSLAMRVNLITNGTLIDRSRAKALKKAGLASAQVSIESATAEEHDAIVGIQGAQQRSISGLLALKDQRILVHPHATICAANKQSVHQLADLACDLGVDRFSLNLVIPAGRGSERANLVSYSETSAILERVMQRARAVGVRFMWYSPTPLCLFNPIAFGMGNKGCSACEGLLSVDPSGNVLPCSSWSEPVGNLLTDGFETIWYGKRARFIREKRCAHEGCRQCEHFAVCQGACPLYFRVLGHNELEPYLACVQKRSLL